MRTWRPRALPSRRLATTGGAPQGARSVTPIVGSDYQSDRHCAKTENTRLANETQFDYQSDRRCAKTKELY